MEFLKTYLEGIRDISPEAKEHTYRTPLEGLLNALKDELAKENKSLACINIKHEPNNDKQGRGAPDFQILRSGLTIGYIENKRVNDDLDSRISSEQIKKYLELNDNIMLTDYLRFLFVRKSGDLTPDSGWGASKGKNEIIVKTLRICELSELISTLKNKSFLESKTKELLDFFIFFFTHHPKPISSASEFASALALRTKEVKSELLHHAKIPILKAPI